MKIDTKNITSRISEEMKMAMTIAINNAGLYSEEANKEYYIAMGKHEAYLHCLHLIIDAIKEESSI